MKIGGKKVEALSRGKVKIVRLNGDFWEVDVRAFRLGEETLADRMFPEPVPPVEFVLGNNGLPLRDPMTNKPMREPNMDNPQYREAVDRAAQLRYVVMAVSVMENVTFDSTAAAHSKQWYEDVFDELVAAGITIGDLKLVIDKAQDLSTLTEEKIKEAAESF